MVLTKAATLPQNVQDVLNKMMDRQDYSLVSSNGLYYIIATRGEMRTSGYSINIDDAKVIKDSDETTLEVNVSYVNPPRGSYVSQVLMYPYDVKSFTYDGKITKVIINTKVSRNITKVDYINL
ncbi:protease complex subunit PrcB family protein [Thermoanaerobacterium thermosaccharolyticum]|uniref:protease complex subunit PrcB family protein n=1 Tax=Thermoanaerobacterium thermosaccharolyticum TaxID=1517 RepID=UPI003DA853F4